MSKKKQGGKITQHVRPEGKRLGLKVGDGQTVPVGSILVRQRGTKILAGEGVKTGRDHTLFAVRPGIVKFKTVDGHKKVTIVTG